MESLKKALLGLTAFNSALFFILFLFGTLGSLMAKDYKCFGVGIVCFNVCLTVCLWSFDKFVDSVFIKKAN